MARIAHTTMWLHSDIALNFACLPFLKYLTQHETWLTKYILSACIDKVNLDFRACIDKV